MILGRNVYTELALGELWRLVGLINRNPYSNTKGSLSRTHWSWKFEDFPFPRLQEGVCALAMFYNMEEDANPFYRSDDALTWIEWGLDYWMSLQHPSGAFDEAYPNEQCLAATAFTGFYLATAYLEVEDRLHEDLKGRVRKAFYKAGEWLLQNDEYHGVLSNHLAAAVAALEVIGRICGEPRFQQRANVFLDRLLAHQSSEGWMLEYEGADIGYGTHGLFYLAVYWHHTREPKVLEALSSFSEFLKYCVHPDGTIGGEYSSRNTEFYYPAGFEILAPNCAASNAIAGYLRRSLAERRVCGVYAMDVFNFMPMLNNILFAHRFYGKVKQSNPLPCFEKPFRRYFAEAGLWIINTEQSYAVIGLAKGGTLSVFDKTKRKLKYRFAGYLFQDGQEVFTSQNYRLRPSVTWSEDGLSAFLTVPWRISKQTTFTPLLFMAFRMFTISVGRNLKISRWVKGFLVRVLIKQKNAPLVSHERNLTVKYDKLIVTDRLRVPGHIRHLLEVSQMTSIHMGSSLYPDIRAASGSTRNRKHELDATGITIITNEYDLEDRPATNEERA